MRTGLEFYEFAAEDCDVTSHGIYVRTSRSKTLLRFECVDEDDEVCVDLELDEARAFARAILDLVGTLEEEL